MNGIAQWSESIRTRLHWERPALPSEGWPQTVRVMGLGHVLMGDDGFGPAVIEIFRCQYECELGVEVLDLGTPGLDLAPYFYGADLVILVDCVAADEKPGRLRLYRENDVRSGCPGLRVTGHDPGFQESLVHLKLANREPSELLILGVAPESCEFGKAMSPAVAAVCTAAADTIACLLADHGIRCLPRSAPVSPNLWWLPEFPSGLFISDGRSIESS
jgi:hydrogenase maturation protease